MKLWGDAKSVERSEINSKNHCGGREVAARTHTGGSVSIGEHRKRLAVEKGRDPTPSELHLHVHPHDHDGEFFIAERFRIIHEKYEEILREKTQSQTDIDQCEAYYKAAGGEKRKIVYGLGYEVKSYYGSKFVSSGSVASSSIPSSTSQSIPSTNMSEFMDQLILALIDHFLPVVLQRVHKVISSPPTNGPSVVIPTVPPATTNAKEVDPLVSDDDHRP